MTAASFTCVADFAGVSALSPALVDRPFLAGEADFTSLTTALDLGVRFSVLTGVFSFLSPPFRVPLSSTF